uniref:Uncharacterized protein n=1 Tax=Zea mays TaxID=4577 RepID=C4J3H4_MAIZE|nr:unknown [Zea mays]
MDPLLRHSLPPPLLRPGQLAAAALGKDAAVAASACPGTAAATMGADLAAGALGPTFTMGADLATGSLSVTAFSVDQRPLLTCTGAAGQLAAAAAFSIGQHRPLSRSPSTPSSRLCRPPSRAEARQRRRAISSPATPSFDGQRPCCARRILPLLRKP